MRLPCQNLRKGVRYEVNADGVRQIQGTVCEAYGSFQKGENDFLKSNTISMGANLRS